MTAGPTPAAAQAGAGLGLPSGPRRTIIGAQTRFQGTIKGQGAVIVCGAVRGAVEIEGALAVTAGGTVEADVTVESAQIAGSTRGTLRAAQRVRIEAAGQHEGRIETPVIDLRPGSVLRGQVSILGLPGASHRRSTH
jgi:cytoskeletal protein CcmA (bactofilin family)